MTKTEIETQIQKVDDAIDAALLGQTYSMDTGEGRISVTRASLNNLRQYRSELERRLSRLNGDDYPTSAEVWHDVRR